jgi:hypothetical protein
VQELDGGSAKVYHSKPINNTHKLRKKGFDKRTSVTIRVSYLKDLLGESKKISCQTV